MKKVLLFLLKFLYRDEITIVKTPLEQGVDPNDVLEDEDGDYIDDIEEIHQRFNDIEMKVNDIICRMEDEKILDICLN